MSSSKLAPKIATPKSNASPVSRQAAREQAEAEALAVLEEEAAARQARSAQLRKLRLKQEEAEQAAE